MIKYVILNYSNPNINNMKADLSLLCITNKNDKLIYYWSKDFNQKHALTFDERKHAEMYIKNMELTNCISYGINI